MRYIIIKNVGIGSIPRRDKINKCLFDISRPVLIKDTRDVTTGFLSQYDNGELGALGFEDTDDLPVHAQMDVQELKDVLGDDLTGQEKAQFEAYIRSKIIGRINFVDIIQSTMTIYTKQ